VADLALIRKFIWGQQREPEKGLASNGRQLKVHLVPGSAWPERGPHHPTGLFRVEDQRFSFICQEVEPLAGAGLAWPHERLSDHRGGRGQLARASRSQACAQRKGEIAGLAWSITSSNLRAA
jgi:hypothetical protein